MKRIPVALLMAGLASLAVACSHSKQKIVYVTEFVSCKNFINKCTDYPMRDGSTYRGHKNANFAKEVDAAVSVCKGMGMLKREFTDKVNADKFRVISTTDWEGETQYNYVLNAGGGGDYTVRCIGKEYVVSY